MNNVISVSQTDFIMLTDKIIRRKIKDKILISTNDAYHTQCIVYVRD